MTIAPGSRTWYSTDTCPPYLAQLLEQRQRIVIVHESHGFTRRERIERPEDGGVAETRGDAASVERLPLPHAKSSAGQPSRPGAPRFPEMATDE